MEENKEKMQSDTLGKLFEALAKAQGKMDPAIKDKKNPFYKSMYADINSIWAACKVPLSENGLCLIQTIEGTKELPILITWLGHSSGEWIKSRLPMIVSKSDAQGMGSALTYFRRYALSAIIGAVSDEDDDAETDVRHPEKPKVDTKSSHKKVDTISCQEPPKLPEPPKVITEEMEEELKALLMQDLDYKSKVDEYLGSKNFTSLIQLQHSDFIKLMKRAKERLNDPTKSKD